MLGSRFFCEDSLRLNDSENLVGVCGVLGGVVHSPGHAGELRVKNWTLFDSEDLNVTLHAERFRTMLNGAFELEHFKFDEAGIPAASRAPFVETVNAWLFSYFMAREMMCVHRHTALLSMQEQLKFMNADRPVNDAFCGDNYELPSAFPHYCHFFPGTHVVPLMQIARLDVDRIKIDVSQDPTLRIMHVGNMPASGGAHVCVQGRMCIDFYNVEFQVDNDNTGHVRGQYHIGCVVKKIHRMKLTRDSIDAMFAYVCDVLTRVRRIPENVTLEQLRDFDFIWENALSGGNMYGIFPDVHHGPIVARLVHGLLKMNARAMGDALHYAVPVWFPHALFSRDGNPGFIYEGMLHFVAKTDDNEYETVQICVEHSGGDVEWMSVMKKRILMNLVCFMLQQFVDQFEQRVIDVHCFARINRIMLNGTVQLHTLDIHGPVLLDVFHQIVLAGHVACGYSVFIPLAPIREVPSARRDVMRMILDFNARGMQDGRGYLIRRATVAGSSDEVDMQVLQLPDVVCMRLGSVIAVRETRASGMRGSMPLVLVMTALDGAWRRRKLGFDDDETESSVAASSAAASGRNSPDDRGHSPAGSDGGGYAPEYNAETIYPYATVPFLEAQRAAERRVKTYTSGPWNSTPPGAYTPAQNYVLRKIANNVIQAVGAKVLLVYKLAMRDSLQKVLATEFEHLGFSDPPEMMTDRKVSESSPYGIVMRHLHIYFNANVERMVPPSGSYLRTPPGRPFAHMSQRFLQGRDALCKYVEVERERGSEFILRACLREQGLYSEYRNAVWVQENTTDIEQIRNAESGLVDGSNIQDSEIQPAMTPINLATMSTEDALRHQIAVPE